MRGRSCAASSARSRRGRRSIRQARGGCFDLPRRISRVPCSRRCWPACAARRPARRSNGPARDPMLLEIAEGQLDIAIAPAGLRLPAGITAEMIGALTWGCFARRGHPAFRKWGRNAWSRWPHVAVRVGDSLASPVNAAAAAAGLERTIAAWVPHFSGMAPVLGDSDLLATLPAVAMADTLRQYGLDSRPVPFPIEPLPHAMLWSTRRGNDPEIAWLRDRLRPIVNSKFTGAASSRR